MLQGGFGGSGPVLCSGVDGGSGSGPALVWRCGPFRVTVNGSGPVDLRGRGPVDLRGGGSVDLRGSGFVFVLWEGWGDRRQSGLGGASGFFPVGFSACSPSVFWSDSAGGWASARGGRSRFGYVGSVP